MDSSASTRCAGPCPLWDDSEGLAEESPDDARTHPRMLCGLQDTRRVRRSINKQKGNGGTQMVRKHNVPPLRMHNTMCTNVYH